MCSKGLIAVTIEGEREIKGGGLICGLNIKGLEGEEINLPPVHVIDQIPVGKEDCVSKQDLERYEHLRYIDVREGGNVELLLGSDCPRLYGTNRDC